jgi:uncharacterized membrane protein
MLRCAGRFGRRLQEISTVIAGTEGLTASLRQIELLPNCSLTPRSATLFFMSIAALSLTIAVVCVLLGYWPVLPFAGLELGLLGWALQASLKRRQWTQVLTISEQEVTIATRVDGRIETGEHQVVFPRHWASVRLCGPRGWQPSRLLVESHGRSCEVGSFLTEEERRALYERLRVLVGRINELPSLSGQPLTGAETDPLAH